MRKDILCYINGEEHHISGKQAMMSVAEYLRYIKGLTGTKVVCSEGDCGACTILVSRLMDGQMSQYKSINSCISYMYLMDRCHLVSVEGLKKDKELHEVQSKMVKYHGAQCGFCTPGIVCAMANMTEDLKITQKSNTEQKVKNYLTGNLCRCTGYKPIIKAGTSINIQKVELLGAMYNDKKISEVFLANAASDILITYENKEIYIPAQFYELIKYKTDHTNCTIVSGATDLGVLVNKGVVNLNRVLCLYNLKGAYKISHSNEKIELGAMASFADVERECKNDFSEFSQLLHIFASPQIKNNGTLMGNLLNASPIADTTPFLLVADASIELVSSAGTREIKISDFIQPGYKQLDLKPNEFGAKIILPKSDYDYKLYKISTRKDLDISTVSMACRYKLHGQKIAEISFAFGGVGPRVLRTPHIEKLAVNKDFNQDLFLSLGNDLLKEISPQSDHRGSKEFREKLCQNLLLKFCDEVMVENGFKFEKVCL